MESINSPKFKSMKNDAFFTLLEQELADNFSVRFRVKGVSMQPLLRNNRDEVQLIAYTGQPLIPGDICLFKYQGRHILHRYLRKEGEILCFQGDNVVTHCEYCLPGEVVGVVKSIYRDGQLLSPYTTRWRFQTLMNRLRQRIRLGISSFIPRRVKDFIKGR